MILNTHATLVPAACLKTPVDLFFSKQTLKDIVHNIHCNALECAAAIQLKKTIATKETMMITSFSSRHYSHTIK